MKYEVAEKDVGSIFGEEEVAAVRRVFESGQSLSWGVEGPAFEEEFGAYCGAKFAVFMTSCTAALNICAQILRLGPGDEVVSTPQTFSSTILALIQRGVRIRFADIDHETLNIDPATIEAHITPKTRAIYLVHYGGNAAEMDEVRAIADAHRLVIVEDCAHAAGSEYKGQKIGGGDLCCFSFQSLKNMTTGEGGVLTTNSEKWAEEARALAGMGLVGETVERPVKCIGPYCKPDFPLNDHSGDSWDKDWVKIEEVGTHYRPTVVHAAIARVQLRKLDHFIAARASVAQRYNEGIANIPGLRAMRVPETNRMAWHLYACFVDPDSAVDRNALARYLEEERGVQIILRFWPLHLGSLMRAAGHAFGECPVCERVWFGQQINLPIHPAMEDWEVNEVIEALSDGMRKCRR